MADVYGVVANIISDHILRTGAKVWLVYHNGDASNPRVIGLNKGGRIVEKYVKHKRLENYRAAWIPEHLRSRVIWQWDAKEEAQIFADGLSAMWSGVRSFKRDGTMIRDGISEGEAWRRGRSYSKP